MRDACERTLRLCVALALLSSLGCGDDEPNEMAHEDGGHHHDSSVDEMAEPDSSVDEMAEPDAAVEDGGTDAEVPAEPGLYALVAQVFADDAANNQSYVVVTDALEGNTMLSLDDGIELAGRAIGVGPVEGGVIFVGGDSGPTLTRYDLRDDGSLEEGDTVSFIGEGVATIGEYGGQFHFVADDKAYFFDGPTAQMVIWNPEAMTVTGATALSDLVIEGATLTFTASPLLVGNKLITFAGWRLGPAVPSEVGIVVVDTTSDEVTVIRDDRCGYARDGALGDDGLVYVATEAYGAAVHRLNADNAAAPCLLRFDPETSELDASFELALNELGDGAPTGSLVRGPEGSVFLRVLDEAVVDIAEDTHPRVLASAAAWQWASVTLGDAPSLSLLDTEPGGGSVVMQELGEHFIAPIFAGSESTTLVPLTSDGLGAPLASIPGLVFSAVKLR